MSGASRSRAVQLLSGRRSTCWRSPSKLTRWERERVGAVVTGQQRPLRQGGRPGQLCQRLKGGRRGQGGGVIGDQAAGRGGQGGGPGPLALQQVGEERW